MDASSELIHSLLPLYMASVLGASLPLIGLIEGIAEATAQITKIFSGALSDRLGRRKLLVVSGYGLSALTKFVFPATSSLAWVTGARFADRIGKGIRGAPRDALVADLTPPPLRGAAYGLRQALDSVGAFLGPALAVAGMALFGGDVKATLWIAVIPAALAVALLAAGIREPERNGTGTEAGRPVARPPAHPSHPAKWTGLGGLGGFRRLPSGFWLIATVGAVFSLARFSEAFLVLRAGNAGLPMEWVPSILIVMNVVYAAAAFPAGAAADRWSRRALLAAGLAILIAADIALAAASSPWPVFLAALLWGLHLAMTQGLFSKLVSASCPADLRGTAFGVFHLVSGVSLLGASAVAGVLWQRLGPPAAFLTGAAFASLALLGVLAYRPPQRPGSRPGGSPGDDMRRRK